MMMFWVLAPCTLVSRCYYFGETFGLEGGDSMFLQNFGFFRAEDEGSNFLQNIGFYQPV
jgi:hypothetical protein